MNSQIKSDPADDGVEILVIQREQAFAQENNDEPASECVIPTQTGSN